MQGSITQAFLDREIASTALPGPKFPTAVESSPLLHLGNTISEQDQILNGQG
jgi:hypothetical protein